VVSVIIEINVERLLKTPEMRIERSVEATFRLVKQQTNATES